MDAIKQSMNSLIDSMKENLWAISDDIFDHPEVPLEEFRSSAILMDWLEEHGFAVERGLGSLPTAFRAVYENGFGGPSIGLLCEYDALSGMGHACGHHMQGPCIMAAAQAIKEANLEEPFRLVVYGTPGEEGKAGKSIMLREGYLQDIDVALMMHASPTTTCDIKSMANYHVEVTFSGVGSHAAINPDGGRSALDALLLTFQGVEFLREHVKEDTRIHYTVSNTYNIPANVVPYKATGSFILRSYNTFVLEEVMKRFRKIVDGAAMMTETTAEFNIRTKMSAKIPVLRLNQLLLNCAAEIGAPRIGEPRKKPGSTDLADVMMVVPGSCIRVAFVPENTPSHSQQFLDNGKAQEAHDAILYGAKVLANASYDMIRNPVLLQEIREEHKERKAKLMQEA